MEATLSDNSLNWVLGLDDLASAPLKAIDKAMSDFFRDLGKGTKDYSRDVDSLGKQLDRAAQQTQVLARAQEDLATSLPSSAAPTGPEKDSFSFAGWKQKDLGGGPLLQKPELVVPETGDPKGGYWKRLQGWMARSKVGYEDLSEVSARVAQETETHTARVTKGFKQHEQQLNVTRRSTLHLGDAYRNLKGSLHEADSATQGFGRTLISALAIGGLVALVMQAAQRASELAQQNIVLAAALNETEEQFRSGSQILGEFTRRYGFHREAVAEVVAAGMQQAKAAGVQQRGMTDFLRSFTKEALTFSKATGLSTQEVTALFEMTARFYGLGYQQIRGFAASFKYLADTTGASKQELSGFLKLTEPLMRTLGLTGKSALTATVELTALGAAMQKHGLDANQFGGMLNDFMGPEGIEKMTTFVSVLQHSKDSSIKSVADLQKALAKGDFTTVLEDWSKASESFVKDMGGDLVRSQQFIKPWLENLGVDPRQFVQARELRQEDLRGLVKSAREAAEVGEQHHKAAKKASVLFSEQMAALWDKILMRINRLGLGKRIFKGLEDGVVFVIDQFDRLLKWYDKLSDSDKSLAKWATGIGFVMLTAFGPLKLLTGGFTALGLASKLLLNPLGLLQTGLSFLTGGAASAAKGFWGMLPAVGRVAASFLSITGIIGGVRQAWDEATKFFADPSWEGLFMTLSNFVLGVFDGMSFGMVSKFGDAFKEMVGIPKEIKFNEIMQGVWRQVGLDIESSLNYVVSGFRDFKRESIFVFEDIARGAVQAFEFFTKWLPIKLSSIIAHTKTGLAGFLESMAVDLGVLDASDFRRNEALRTAELKASDKALEDFDRMRFKEAQDRTRLRQAERATDAEAEATIDRGIRAQQDAYAREEAGIDKDRFRPSGNVRPGDTGAYARALRPEKKPKKEKAASPEAQLLSKELTQGVSAMEGHLGEVVSLLQRILDEARRGQGGNRRSALVPS